MSGIENGMNEPGNIEFERNNPDKNPTREKGSVELPGKDSRKEPEILEKQEADRESSDRESSDDVDRKAG